MTFDRFRNMVDHIDVPTMSTKLQNTLIQYHSLLEDEWSVAKKSVSFLVAFNQRNLLRAKCHLH